MYTYPKYGLARIVVPVMTILLTAVAIITQILINNSQHADKAFGVFIIQAVLFISTIVLFSKECKTHIEHIENIVNEGQK